MVANLKLQIGLEKKAGSEKDVVVREAAKRVIFFSGPLRP